MVQVRVEDARHVVTQQLDLVRLDLGAVQAADVTVQRRQDGRRVT